MSTAPSTDGRVVISAKEEIILSCGGGYIRIGDGVVETGAPDKLIQRAAVWQKFDAESLSQQFNQRESTPFAVTPQVVWPYSFEPVQQQDVFTEDNGGNQSQSTTSSDGKGELQKRIDVDSLTFSLNKKEKYNTR